ncbi:hypothetical protein BH10BAC6_BH10BAC6_11890 [soil metagenome]
MELVVPTLEHLPSYRDALERGWMPDNVNLDSGREHLARIKADGVGFVRSFVDREALGGPILLPDGSSAARLPSIRLWMWDGEFCGSIGFRWQPGTEELPPHVLGHIGYTVVDWKQRQGYATKALAEILPYASAEGLRWVELTTDLDNAASQRTILNNHGVLIEQFEKPAAYGHTPGLRFRIILPGSLPAAAGKSYDVGVLEALPVQYLRCPAERTMDVWHHVLRFQIERCNVLLNRLQPIGIVLDS